MHLPTRSAALSALKTFLPHAAEKYTRERNYAYDSDGSNSVSGLSPWIRMRMLTECEVLQAVMDLHGEAAPLKFIDEVCWRTYWKGWLEQRPSIWWDYLQQRARLLAEFNDNVSYNNAIKAETGIAFFDAVTRELNQTGYLHNHSRMWYASIWIHTLQLPWELGADWFLRHLLDGDPASNTLSWRWVAGLHTRDKAYLAQPSNIHTFTSGRFIVDYPLATEPVHAQFVEHPAPQMLRQETSVWTSAKCVLLVTDEDLSSPEWLGQQVSHQAVVGFLPLATYRELSISQGVIDFRKACLLDKLNGPLFTEIDELQHWLSKHALDGVVMAMPPVGLWDSLLPRLETALQQSNRQLILRRHWWDAYLYPFARHGFFKFKKAIPSALKHLKEHTAQ